VIRVGDLTLFQPIRAETLAEFTTVRERTVRITVNTVGRTALHVLALDEDGSLAEDVAPMFLTTVDGLEDVEFYAHGPFAIQGDGDWNLKTLDGQPVHVAVPDAEAFVRISERRARNPEIERLQAMLLQNQERRMGAMYEEVRLEREALAREREEIEYQRTSADSGGEQPPASGEAAGTGEPAPHAGSSGKTKGGTDDGS